MHSLGDLVYVPPAQVEVIAVEDPRDLPQALRAVRRAPDIVAYRIEIAGALRRLLSARRGPWVFGAAHLHAIIDGVASDPSVDTLVARVRDVPAAVSVTPGVLPSCPAYDEDGGVWVHGRELPPTTEIRDGPQPKSPLSRRIRGRDGEARRRAEDRELRHMEDLSFDRMMRARDSVAESPPAAAPARESAPPSREHALRRVPHLELDAEPPLAPAQSFAFGVFCDDQPASPGQSVTPVDIVLSEGVEEVVVDVWVDGGPHIAIDGPARRSLLLCRDVATSERLTFTAHVIDDPPPGDAAIRAVFEYDGRARGSIEAAVPLKDGATGISPPPEEALRPAPLVRVTQGDRRPDVTVVVLKTRVAGEYTVRVTAQGVEGYEERGPESWTLGSDAARLVAEHLEAFADDGITTAERRSRLEGAGMEFWRVVPEAFADLYWTLSDRGRQIGTLLVASQEPAFPWELAVPHRGMGVCREVHAPLGVSVAIGRNVDETLVGRDQDLVLDSSWVLVPQYVSRPLKHAAEEAEFICANFGGERIAPSSFDGIEAAFASRAVPLFHLACHGATGPGIAQAVLLDDDVRLLSVQVAAMEKLAAAVARREPLVFVNACEVGRTTPDLLGVGGFAVKFLELGARCVVAPLWKVEDTVAHEFAMEFYRRLTAEHPDPPAVIVQQLRARAYEEDGADTWAAYCFFGDPGAELRAEPGIARRRALSPARAAHVEPCP